MAPPKSCNCCFLQTVAFSRSDSLPRSCNTMRKLSVVRPFPIGAELLLDRLLELKGQKIPLTEARSTQGLSPLVEDANQLLVREPTAHHPGLPIAAWHDTVPRS